MDMFFQTIGWVLALALGIIILSIFFTALGYLRRFLDQGKLTRLPGLNQNSNLVTIHLMDGSVMENVKVLGSASSSPKDGHLPHRLSQMLVIQEPNGLKTYLRPESVKMIKELPLNN